MFVGFVEVSGRADVLSLNVVRQWMDQRSITVRPVDTEGIKTSSSEWQWMATIGAMQELRLLEIRDRQKDQTETWRLAEQIGHIGTS